MRKAVRLIVASIALQAVGELSIQAILARDHSCSFEDGCAEKPAGTAEPRALAWNISASGKDFSYDLGLPGGVRLHGHWHFTVATGAGSLPTPGLSEPQVAPLFRQSAQPAMPPPSTTNDSPVMKEASSEARKSTASAISSAVPMRPSGRAAAPAA